MDVLPIPKPNFTDNLSSFPLVFVYRILVSGIGCFFHVFSCFNFNPVMKNSSCMLEFFATLQGCLYFSNLYRATIILTYGSISLFVFVHSSCIQTSFCLALGWSTWAVTLNRKLCLTSWADLVGWDSPLSYLSPECHWMSVKDESSCKGLNTGDWICVVILPYWQDKARAALFIVALTMSVWDVWVLLFRVKPPRSKIHLVHKFLDLHISNNSSRPINIPYDFPRVHVIDWFSSSPVLCLNLSSVSSLGSDYML